MQFAQHELELSSDITVDNNIYLREVCTWKCIQNLVVICGPTLLWNWTVASEAKIMQGECYHSSGCLGSTVGAATLFAFFHSRQYSTWYDHHVRPMEGIGAMGGYRLSTF